MFDELGSIRPLSILDDEGCILRNHDGEANLEIHKSLFVPISIIDSQKVCTYPSSFFSLAINFSAFLSFLLMCSIL